MRRKFSDKYGFTSPRKVLQIDSIDERLKNRIWNVISSRIFDKVVLNGIYNMYTKDTIYINRIYDEHFGTTYKMNTFFKAEVNKIKKNYSEMKWFEIYNFVEELIFLHYDDEIKRVFKIGINEVLEQEIAGYRFVDDCITPIIDEVEIKEIEEVFASKYLPVKRHLSNALELLSDRENPNYPKSIGESITAVESLTKILSGKESDLSTCLKALNIDLNKQFKTALNNLYGWTNKEDGIRHGHTKEELKTSFDEAKFMLVTCSAFINYIISKNKS